MQDWKEETHRYTSITQYTWVRKRTCSTACGHGTYISEFRDVVFQDVVLVIVIIIIIIIIIRLVIMRPHAHANMMIRIGCAPFPRQEIKGPW